MNGVDCKILSNESCEINTVVVLENGSLEVSLRFFLKMLWEFSLRLACDVISTIREVIL